MSVTLGQLEEYKAEASNNDETPCVPPPPFSPPRSPSSPPWRNPQPHIIIYPPLSYIPHPSMNYLSTVGDKSMEIGEFGVARVWSQSYEKQFSSRLSCHYIQYVPRLGNSGECDGSMNTSHSKLGSKTICWCNVTKQTHGSTLNKFCEKKNRNHKTL